MDGKGRPQVIWMGRGGHTSHGWEGKARGDVAGKGRPQIPCLGREGHRSYGWEGEPQVIWMGRVDNRSYGWEGEATDPSVSQVHDKYMMTGL